MFGLVVEVAIAENRGEAAEKLLEEMIVPMVKSLPGFVSGNWLQSDDGRSGTTVIIFESEGAARSAVASFQSPPEAAGVTIKRLEPMRVATSA